MDQRRPRHLLALLVAGGVFSLLAAACGGTSAPSGGPIVSVTERDFQITAPVRVPAGTVVFRVHNLGPDNHEFIVVHLANGALPLRTDGMTVNEEKLESQTVGSLEPGPPGSIRYLKVELPPGRYEVLCNMEGHFMGGMHHALTAVA